MCSAQKSPRTAKVCQLCNKMLNEKKKYPVKLITLIFFFFFPDVKAKFLAFKVRNELLLMAQTCQCSLIPVCHFVLLAAFVRSQRGIRYKVTNEGSRNLNASDEVKATQRALGLLLAHWGCQRALIRPHCASGRCVNPVRLGGDPGTSPVGYCTVSFRATPRLSPPVEADVA